VLAEPKPDAAERFRFTFLHQQRDRFLDIADFIRSRELATECGQVDVLSFQLVTMGQPIATSPTSCSQPTPTATTAEPGCPFGYGACPNFEERAKMMERLQPGRIGVDLSEGLQLHPEQSTDAFLLHHPEAKYSNV